MLLLFHEVVVFLKMGKPFGGFLGLVYNNNFSV